MIFAKCDFKHVLHWVISRYVVVLIWLDLNDILFLTLFFIECRLVFLRILDLKT